MCTENEYPRARVKRKRSLIPQLGYRSKQKAAEASEDRAVADGIIAEFDVMLRKFLADHADKTEEVKKFISRFAKNADYSKIKEPALAAKLLDDFKHQYIEETKGE